MKENRPTIQIHFTNGFGNNIFQYVYSKLLSEYHNSNLSIILPKKYYAKNSLEKIGIKIKNNKLSSSFPTLRLKENQNAKTYFDRKYNNYNFILRGYFEDYTIYKDSLDRVKTWFVNVPKTNSEDLVFHLRLGDRLVYKNSYDPGMKVDPLQYINAMNNFKFARLYIVTDMKIWNYTTENQINNMKFHRTVPKKYRIDPKISMNYMNSFIEEFKPFNPIVKLNDGDIAKDFNFIRSFDKILFQHSTLAWWAGVLSNASKIGVYGPWRPNKGARNKNLGNTNLKGWFQWE